MFAASMLMTDVRDWATLILVTTIQDVGDRINMWATIFIGAFLMYKIDYRHLGWSQTSQSCQQHISSPTSVTNINVAWKWFMLFAQL